MLFHLLLIACIIRLTHCTYCYTQTKYVTNMYGVKTVISLYEFHSVNYKFGQNVVPTCETTTHDFTYAEREKAVKEFESAAESGKKFDCSELHEIIEKEKEKEKEILEQKKEEAMRIKLEKIKQYELEQNKKKQDLIDYKNEYISKYGETNFSLYHCWTPWSVFILIIISIFTLCCK